MIRLKDQKMSWMTAQKIADFRWKCVPINEDTAPKDEVMEARDKAHDDAMKALREQFAESMGQMKDQVKAAAAEKELETGGLRSECDILICKECSKCLSVPISPRSVKEARFMVSARA